MIHIYSFAIDNFIIAIGQHDMLGHVMHANTR